MRLKREQHVYAEAKEKRDGTGGREGMKEEYRKEVEENAPALWQKRYYVFVPMWQNSSTVPENTWVLEFDKEKACKKEERGGSQKTKSIGHHTNENDTQ